MLTHKLAAGRRLLDMIEPTFGPIGQQVFSVRYLISYDSIDVLIQETHRHLMLWLKVLRPIVTNWRADPETDREHVFQPFYSNKTHGEETGLGLSPYREQVESQGGQINPLQAPLGGTRLSNFSPRGKC
jgi:nitrogen-specific signal transduction histidine kinase